MKPEKMKIILGTSSKSRKRVFDTLGCVYEVMSPDIDEKAIRFEDPDKLVLAIAEAKASALVKRVSESCIIITADTVVVCNNEVREKPKDKKEAFSFFSSYCKYPAEAHTGLVVTNTANGKQARGVDISRVYYQKTPDSVIQKMIEYGDVMNASGGFLIDDQFSRPFIERIEGTEDSLSGLPIALLQRLFNEV